ncbi:MAG: segregation and condensation protein A, partial [Pseudomonadota bacterium]
GEPVTELPRDLYIPPDALEVFLDTFEGPLDLLLYLIRRQNLDILNIPILTITRQYMEYVELMKALRLELAAEYLVMAAMLAEIKSRMLLPRPAAAEEEEGEDPRAELVRRLQEYERYKQAAEDLDALPRMERDVVAATVEAAGLQTQRPQPQVGLDELLNAFRSVLQRADLHATHHVEREALSVRERMSSVLAGLSESGHTAFTALFDPTEGRSGVVVTFLAVLELLKEGLVAVVQNDINAPIHVRAAAGAMGGETGSEEASDG